MTRKLYNYFNKPPTIPAMFIDGEIYVALAILAFIQIMLATDEAGKFIGLQALWWSKLVVGAVNAGLLALKLFRSTSFANYKTKEEAGLDDSEPLPITEAQAKAKDDKAV